MKDASTSKVAPTPALKGQADHVLSKWLPKKIRARHIALANALYDHLQPVSWKTELTLARELGVTTRQIKRAKAYLEFMGRLTVQVMPNGKRANPIHTLLKPSPIKPMVGRAVGGSRLIWEAFESICARDLNAMSLDDLLDVYEEIGFPFFPLHYPKFKPDGTPYCSCKRGRSCPHIGKHPVRAFKELDFTMRHTYREKRAHWFEGDIRYNVGIRTDSFIVVDVDYRSGGRESLGLLEDDLGELPATLTVKTGNGRHIYLRDAGGIGSSMVGLWAGIDVKAGGGSYVVAPFSVHKSRNEYVWETVGVPKELPEAWRYAMTDGKPAKTPTGIRRGGNRSGVRGKIALPWVLTPDYVIQNHYRSDTLFAFASRERGRGGEYQRILDVITEINSIHCQEPLTARELENIAASACTYPTNAEKLIQRAA